MEILLPIVAILGIYHTIRIYLAGRAARKEYEAVEYRNCSTPNTEPWRWRQPAADVALQVKDIPAGSTIALEPHFNVSDYVLAVGGFLALGAFVLALPLALYFEFLGDPVDVPRGHAGLVLAGIAFTGGFVALSVRQRLVTLIRTPTHLVLEYTYGVFLRRRLQYPKTATLVCKVKDQSITDYDVEQDRPFYQLTVKRVSFFSLMGHDFYVYANPSQMSWLEGGIRNFFAPEPDRNEPEASPS